MCLWSILLTSTTSTHAQPPQQPVSSSATHTSERTVNKTFKSKYLLYLPEGYNEKKQQWPLMMFLHSAGARGEKPEAIQAEGLPFLLTTGLKIPFIVVAPQCPADEWWDSRWSIETLSALLDDVAEKYNVDARRVYLTGWSMGGAGTWRFASEYPKRFAAIAPICGRSQLRYVPQLQTTPVWAFHGEKDTIVPISESQKMVDSLKAAGGQARLALLKDVGHEAWREAYSDPRLYEWFLLHSKKQDDNN